MIRRCFYCHQEFKVHPQKNYCSEDCRIKYGMITHYSRYGAEYQKTEKGKEINRKSSRKWFRKKTNINPENFRV